MVKGVSRQVILVRSPEPRLFEQAIFILRDDAPGEGVTEEALLKEAEQAVRCPQRHGKKRRLRYSGPVWACGGAALPGLVWLVTALL